MALDGGASGARLSFALSQDSLTVVGPFDVLDTTDGVVRDPVVLTLGKRLETRAGKALQEGIMLVTQSVGGAPQDGTSSSYEDVVVTIMRGRGWHPRLEPLEDNWAWYYLH